MYLVYFTRLTAFIRLTVFGSPIGPVISTAWVPGLQYQAYVSFCRAVPRDRKWLVTPITFMTVLNP